MTSVSASVPSASVTGVTGVTGVNLSAAAGTVRDPADLNAAASGTRSAPSDAAADSAGTDNFPTEASLISDDSIAEEAAAAAAEPEQIGRTWIEYLSSPLVSRLYATNPWFGLTTTLSMWKKLRPSASLFSSKTISSGTPSSMHSEK
ncbi:unnamed protein product [Closterium sp. NIES-54]